MVDIRIGISVEGDTEERFVKEVLKPYLIDKNIEITPINMGGNICIQRVARELQKIAYSFDYVTTFYDFYGFKDKDKNETKESLEEKIREAVKDGVRPKLISYIQMYEFEALLFSSPEAIASVLPNKNKLLSNWATKVLADFNGNPERINNSQQTAPSKRLEAVTMYRKTTHGPIIAQQIGLSKIREMYKGFDEWLVKLECVV